MISRSLLIVATPYTPATQKSYLHACDRTHMTIHLPPRSLALPTLMWPHSYDYTIDFWKCLLHACDHTHMTIHLPLYLDSCHDTQMTQHLTHATTLICLDTSLMWRHWYHLTPHSCDLTRHWCDNTHITWCHDTHKTWHVTWRKSLPDSWLSRVSHMTTQLAT